MRALFVATGIALFLVGLVWTLQGLGYVGGSAMSGVRTWALVGPVVAGLGVSLAIVGARRGS